jgi:hypothetical protein
MTLETFPHLKELGKIPGVADFLVTEISTSEEKNFPLVEFIDTPGLTDGTLKYPFDVDQVIYELAEHATMVMVFLDPIGKALVSRCVCLCALALRACRPAADSLPPLLAAPCAERASCMG